MTVLYETTVTMDLLEVQVLRTALRKHLVSLKSDVEKLRDGGYDTNADLLWRHADAADRLLCKFRTFDKVVEGDV